MRSKNILNKEVSILIMGSEFRWVQLTVKSVNIISFQVELQLGQARCTNSSSTMQTIIRAINYLK